MSRADVVIVGAGIIGLSIAWQLARRSEWRIVVLEKSAAVGAGSTGASSAVCRVRYSLDDMVYLARDGIAAYRDWQDFVALQQPRAAFHSDGVLWMPGDDLQWADREHGRMQALGIASEVFDHHELCRRFPAFSSCTLPPDTVTGESHACNPGGRYFFEPDGGYMDPVACAEDLAQACRGAGVELRYNAAVTGIEHSGGRVTGVRLAEGDLVHSPLVINAAGPWCNALLASVGLELPWQLVPTRIQVLYLDRPEELPGHIPVTVDMASGLYFRTQNRAQQLVVGSTLEQDEREAVPDPDSFNTLADDEFVQSKLHALHHRLPALPYRGKVRSYCGLYTVNRDDMHPVIGPTELAGFEVANGFSGHGFKLAPAVGSLVAQRLTGTRLADDTAVNPNFFAVDRTPIALATKNVLA